MPVCGCRSIPGAAVSLCSPPAHTSWVCSDLHQHQCLPTSLYALYLPWGLCSPDTWHMPPVTDIPPVSFPVVPLWYLQVQETS